MGAEEKHRAQFWEPGQLGIEEFYIFHERGPTDGEVQDPVLAQLENAGRVRPAAKGVGAGVSHDGDRDFIQGFLRDAAELSGRPEHGVVFARDVLADQAEVGGRGGNRTDRPQD